MSGGRWLGVPMAARNGFRGLVALVNGGVGRRGRCPILREDDGFGLLDVRLGFTLVPHGVTEFATANRKDFQGLGFARILSPLEP